MKIPEEIVNLLKEDAKKAYEFKRIQNEIETIDHKIEELERDRLGFEELADRDYGAYNMCTAPEGKVALNDWLDDVFGVVYRHDRFLKGLDNKQ